MMCDLFGSRSAGETLLNVPAFDPEGFDYDLESARAFGMRRDASGHMGSVVPASSTAIKQHGLPQGSYLMLKGRQHETWDKAIAAEEARGSRVKKFGDRYYSIPAR